MKQSVPPTFLLYLRLPYALQGTFCLKKMIFGACPKLKDFSLYERYSIYMYKASINLYLQQFSSTCDSLMPWTVHFLEKDDFFFHEIFQVGACLNLKDSSLYESISIHMNKT